MIHFLVLLLSFVLFGISSSNLKLDYCLILVIPYVWYLIRQVKNYRGRILVPPFMLTLYLVFSIVSGALTIKYGLSANIAVAYGVFSEYSLNKCVYISLMGVSACWLSFSALLKYHDPFKKSLDFNVSHVTLKNGVKSAVILLLGILLLLVATGNFGYYAEDSAMSNYTQKIYQFLLLIVSFYYLYDRNETNGNPLFYRVVVIVLCGLGLLSGSKSLLLIPIFTLYVVESVKTSKWTNKYLKMIPILFAAAFILIIPIRYMIRSNEKLTTEESIALINENSGSMSIGEMVVEDVISRVNYVPVLSVALENEGNGPSNVQKLWEYTFLSPIYAFVPRFIYPDKPSNTFSNWYAYNLMGSTENNHMSASYQGILFMSGGVISVILGFMLVGVLFYFLYCYYFQEKYIYIYMAQLMSFVVLPAEPWVLYVSTIQNVVLYFILHKIIAKR